MSQQHTDEKAEPLFDRTMYGALLRHYRINAGYRKIDGFADDLAAIGLDMHRAAIYRIERGDQEPTMGFVMAANVVLFGDPHSGAIVDSCVPERISNPESSDAVMRVLKKNGVMGKIARESDSSDERARRYDEIMSTISSYDFEVFANGSSDEDNLYMTVMYVHCDTDDCFDETMESYHIEHREDVERSILNFLKTRSFDIPGKEIERLVSYGQRKMRDQLDAYGITD